MPASIGVFQKVPAIYNEYFHFDPLGLRDNLMDQDCRGMLSCNVFSLLNLVMSRAGKVVSGTRGACGQCCQNLGHFGSSVSHIYPDFRYLW